MKSEKPLVFVSCGQFTEAERKLGNDISVLIAELRPDLEPYFAQNQSSVEGLSSNILRALHEAAGFICIMHQRGDVVQGGGRVSIRGSVWIEQEIAIVALMTHVLDRQIPVLFYVQKGVSIEGIRQVLQLNPKVEFTEESEVLDNLKKELPGLTFKRFADYDLVPVITHETAGISSSLHNYVLHATVENTGDQVATDFRLEVHFPSRFLNTNVIFGAVEWKTGTHYCFVADQTRLQGKRLYSGQRLPMDLTIPYHVDDELYQSALSDKIIVKLFSGNMTPKIREYEVREFQEF